MKQAAPVASKQFANYIDNQWLELSFQSQTAGEYIWVLNNPTETVGVWKYEVSSNSSTAYINGSVVSGYSISEISYKSNEYSTFFRNRNRLINYAIYAHQKCSK